MVIFDIFGLERYDIFYLAKKINVSIFFSGKESALLIAQSVAILSNQMLNTKRDPVMPYALWDNLLDS
jgi:hypothetical protein